MQMASSFSQSHHHVHSRYITMTTVKPPNVIAIKKGFTFHAKPQTGAWAGTPGVQPFSIHVHRVFM